MWSYLLHAPYVLPRPVFFFSPSHTDYSCTVLVTFVQASAASTTWHTAWSLLGSAFPAVKRLDICPAAQQPSLHVPPSLFRSLSHLQHLTELRISQLVATQKLKPKELRAQLPHVHTLHIMFCHAASLGPGQADAGIQLLTALRPQLVQLGIATAPDPQDSQQSFIFTPRPPMEVYAALAACTQLRTLFVQLLTDGVLSVLDHLSNIAEVYVEATGVFRRWEDGTAVAPQHWALTVVGQPRQKSATAEVERVAYASTLCELLPLVPHLPRFTCTAPIVRMDGGTSTGAHGCCTSRRAHIVQRVHAISSMLAQEGAGWVGGCVEIPDANFGQSTSYPQLVLRGLVPVMHRIKSICGANL